MPAYKSTTSLLTALARMVRELVRLVCRSAARQASGLGEARQIASDKKISAVLRVAAADPRIAVPPSRWDVHPMLLNTPSGIVDLKTGEVSAGDPALLITQSSSFPIRRIEKGGRRKTKSNDSAGQRAQGRKAKPPESLSMC